MLEGGLSVVIQWGHPLSYASPERHAAHIRSVPQPCFSDWTLRRQISDLPPTGKYSRVGLQYPVARSRRVPAVPEIIQAMRRRGGQGSRAIGALSVPTPVQSTRTTPTTSAHPSAYSTEAEWDPDDDVSTLPMSSLSLASKVTESGAVKKRAATAKTFPFMSLPSELRLKIYAFHFAGQSRPVDLDPTNFKNVHKKLAILRTCRQVYVEASHFFYSTATFRVFPTHPGRFFKTKKPLLARLSPRQRHCITSLELRLGPGWNKPPRGWVVNAALGLSDCFNLRKLTVFVECDPSDGIFNGFRRADGFYEGFCRDLLDGVLAETPWLDSVELDAWPSVKQSGGMIQALLDVVAFQNRRVSWGPERGWADGAADEEAFGSTSATGMIRTIGMAGLVVAA